jgi:hypothetical protein
LIALIKNMYLFCKIIIEIFIEIIPLKDKLPILFQQFSASV